MELIYFWAMISWNDFGAWKCLFLVRNYICEKCIAGKSNPSKCSVFRKNGTIQNIFWFDPRIIMAHFIHFALSIERDSVTIWKHRKLR